MFSLAVSLTSAFPRFRKKVKNYAWSSAGCSILAEFGTMHLEFDYLSEITKKPIYREKVMKIRRKLAEVKRPSGLYPNYLHPKTGAWGQGGYCSTEIGVS